MKKPQRPPIQLRVVNTGRNKNVIRKGSSHSQWRDLYHLLITLSWPKFLGAICLLYLVTNTLFAWAYLAGGNCIGNAQPGSFTDDFFFIVKTLATIGYVCMYPSTAYANGVVAIEALVGLLGVAMVTGLAFARFSIPTARVLFSNVAVIAPFNGLPTLVFRVANQRHSQIVEAQIQMTLVRNEISTEGQFMRRLHDLKLVRSRTPIFAFTLTVMHPIDDLSPLYQATADSLAEEEVQIIITITGIDETVSQTIHARHSYLSSEIIWNAHFVDILSKLPDGRREVDYNRFHDVKIL